MATVYNWNLHDIGQSTFQSIQNEALRNEQAKVIGENIKALEDSARGATAAEREQLLAAASKLRGDMADLGVDAPAPAALPLPPPAPPAPAGLVDRFMALSTGQKAAVGVGALGLGWLGCRLWRGREG